MATNELSVIEWANGLDASELRSWMRQRLQGNDSRWPVDRMSDEPPHHLVDVLLRHPDVKPEIHGYLMDGVLSLIRECLMNAGDWEDSAIIELLLIVPVAMRGTRYEADLRRQIASGLPKLVSGREADAQIESHALRCLLELGHNETPEYWIAKDRPGDSLRNTIICQALLRLDERRMFQWLDSRDVDDLKQLMTVLGRTLRRRCESDLRFAKFLRGILKGKELHEMADEITQIGTVKPSNPATISVLRAFREQIELYEASWSAVELEILGLETGNPEIIYPRRMAISLALFVRTLAKIPDKNFSNSQLEIIFDKFARSLGYFPRASQESIHCTD